MVRDCFKGDSGNLRNYRCGQSSLLKLIEVAETMEFITIGAKLDFKKLENAPYPLLILSKKGQ
jgi:hypothetical protein